jgi:hypothetical protein
MEATVALNLRTIKLEADYQRGRQGRGEYLDTTEFRLIAADEEIARLRQKLEQIRQAVGPLEHSGRCINCDTVRTLARVALEGV